MDIETQNAFKAWILVVEVMGMSPDADFRMEKDKKIDLRTNKDHLDDNYINHEGKQGEKRREIGL